MEKQQDNQAGGRDASEKKKENLEELPMKDSPYLQYKDVEDYKMKAYGTEGHLEPNPGRGAGTTDAPTLSGAPSPADADKRRGAR
ncbi:uncharacterized protein LOC123199780 [Mangifera indica]|uniref:uncharacterized protein LOC123199780 n=1 Tax=Mangifera indica TaxID=29780 RepID=UPI001CFC10A5|nr:uncharacterized protein LOC123199780 [Mangifera indica]